MELKPGQLRRWRNSALTQNEILILRFGDKSDGWANGHVLCADQRQGIDWWGREQLKRHTILLEQGVEDD